MKRELIKNVLRGGKAGAAVVVAGWVRTRRDSKGGFSFVELNDGSCLANLQIVADQALFNYQSEVLKLHPGASVRVAGTLADSPGGGQALELKAEEVKVFGFCDPETYPLQKQRVNFELLREIAHLRPRTNTFGAVARLRNQLAAATHNFFQSRDFLYLNSPIVTSSDCEGAGEMFQVTTLDLANVPRNGAGAVDYSKDFFGRKTGLTVSGQLEGETYACALGDIYTFGPTFRAENSNTRRHLAEFWMIEPEMAFADLHDDAELAEAYVRHLLRHVLDNCQEDLKFFDDRVEKGLVQNLQGIADAPFERMTYGHAVTLLEKSGEKFDFPVGWGCDLQAEHERHLTETICKRPVIVTDYPKHLKSFYMRQNDDGKTVAAMDVLLPGVGEIIGGSQREERLDVITQRIKEMKQDPEDYWWFLDLRRFGTVPHAGFGLGFERAVQFCSGMKNIRDVIPYPRTPGHADF